MPIMQHKNANSSPYLDAFNMVPPPPPKSKTPPATPTQKRRSSTPGKTSSRSAPGTPSSRRRHTAGPVRTPSLHRKQPPQGVKMTLQFSGGLRGATYRLMIKQQPTGGVNPMTVFDGTVSNSETFTFTSKRTAGQNFNAVIFIDGLRYHQLSGCCESRYKEGSSFGNRLQIVSIEGAKPCYKCQFEKEVKKRR